MTRYLTPSEAVSGYLLAHLATAGCPLPTSPGEARELRDRLRSELAMVRRGTKRTLWAPIECSYELALVVSISWLHEVAVGRAPVPR